MKNLYLFDCFGVIVADVSTLWMQYRCTDEQTAEIRRVFRQIDVGNLSFQEGLSQVAKICNVKLEDTYREWSKYEYALWDTVEVVRKLRAQGHVCALLSNANSDYVVGLFEKLGLSDEFDALLISSAFRCAKPDAEFYQAALDYFDEKFDEVYFTDDNPVNIAAALPFGIKAVLFTTAQKLKEDWNLQ